MQSWETSLFLLKSPKFLILREVIHVWWLCFVKEEGFHVQDKGNKIVFCPSIWKAGGGNGNIQWVFIGRGPGARGKEILLDPGETWRSWNLNLASTEFSKRNFCFHKHLRVFRHEKLLLPPPCFSSLRSLWKTFHPENCLRVVLASGRPAHPGCVSDIYGHTHYFWVIHPQLIT